MGRAVKRSPDGGDARRERWRAHREARREEFVDATIRALTKHGPDVGMDELRGSAIGVQFGCKGFPEIVANLGDHDACTLGGEAFGATAADAR